MSVRQLRVVGVTGLLAALCFLVGFLVDPTPPVAGAPASQVLAHASASAADRTAAFMFALSGALLIPFAAGVRAWFADISNAPRWWGSVLLAAAIATGTLLIAASTLFFTLASHPVQNSELATLLSDLINYAFIFVGFGSLLVVFALTALMLATGGPLALLGRIGVPVTLLQVVFLVTALFTSGPLVAGGVVTIVCFSAAGLFVTLTAIAMLWFARLMALASH